jgi:hypothetical protein
MSLRHSIQTYNTKELLKEKTRNSIKNLSIPSKEPNISFEEPHVPLKEPQSPSKTLHISSKKSKHEPHIPSKETYIPFKREINSKKNSPGTFQISSKQLNLESSLHSIQNPIFQKYTKPAEDPEFPTTLPRANRCRICTSTNKKNAQPLRIRYCEF